MNKKHGLTLIELLCALAIMIIVLFAINVVLINGLMINKKLNKDLDVEDIYRTLNLEFTKDVKNGYTFAEGASGELLISNASGKQLIKYTYTVSAGGNKISKYQNTSPAATPIWTLIKDIDYIQGFDYKISSNTELAALKVWGVIEKDSFEKNYIFYFTSRLK